MRGRYGVWTAALAACATGAPLEDTTTTGVATMATMATTSSSTTEDPSTSSTSTSEATTGSTESSTEGTGSSTGSTGDPEVAGELYPFDEIHSPITPAIATSIQTIAAAGPGLKDGVFAKVGGSSTASGNHLFCFANAMQIVELPMALTDTVTFFNTEAAGMGTTSFSRASAAAMAGWTVAEALGGLPSEVGELAPRLALVTLGTHELDQAQPAALFAFEDGLLTIVDTLIAGGTVPILSTIPPRTMPMGIEVEVPRYNAVIRAIAQGRKIPLLDAHLALSGLVGQGLAADGIDLSVSVDGMMTPTPCSFDAASVGYGYNTRNLRTVEALERARRAVAMMPAPDSATELLGAGTPADPIQIPGLPFVDLRTTESAASDAIDAYQGFNCQGADESGPEVIYKLTIPLDTSIRAIVFDRGGVDVDLHLLSSPDEGGCITRNDTTLTGPLKAGTYYIAVDTLGAALPGEFALIVLEDG